MAGGEGACRVHDHVVEDEALHWKRRRAEQHSWLGLGLGEGVGVGLVLGFVLGLGLGLGLGRQSQPSS